MKVESVITDAPQLCFCLLVFHCRVFQRVIGTPHSFLHQHLSLSYSRLLSRQSLSHYHTNMHVHTLACTHCILLSSKNKAWAFRVAISNFFFFLSKVFEQTVLSFIPHSDTVPLLFEVHLWSLRSLKESYQYCSETLTVSSSQTFDSCFWRLREPPQKNRINSEKICGERDIGERCPCWLMGDLKGFAECQHHSGDSLSANIMEERGKHSGITTLKQK